MQRVASTCSTAIDSWPYTIICCSTQVLVFQIYLVYDLQIDKMIDESCTFVPWSTISDAEVSGL